MFTFTPLLGAKSITRASQSIIELDGGIKILVDVGWDERWDVSQLSKLEKYAIKESWCLLYNSLTRSP